MWRLKSSDVWHNMPGIIAAYQPVMSTDPISARINVANNKRTPTQYSATPGVAPTWAAATGWTFNANQYLVTGLTPAITWTIISHHYSTTTGWSGCFAWGNNTGGGFGFSARLTTTARFWNGGIKDIVITDAWHTFALCGMSGVAVDGNYTANTFPGCVPGPMTISIYGSGWAGSFRSFAIYARTLSAAEVWVASHQMKWCDQNPEWNVWARTRKWWFPPDVTVAAGGGGWPVIGPTFIVGKVQ
jgi:hypothetical protein